MLTMAPPRHTAASRCRRPPCRQWQRRHRQALGRRFRFATLTAATLVAGDACCCPRHQHSSTAAAAHALSRTHCLLFVRFCPSLHCPLPLRHRRPRHSATALLTNRRVAVMVYCASPFDGTRGPVSRAVQGPRPHLQRCPSPRPGAMRPVRFAVRGGPA